MLKDSILKKIDDLWPEIWQTARYIYENPEQGNNEFKAVRALTTVLEKFEFSITCPYLGLETSFKAQLGKGKPAVYLLAEYDALPEIGHGCGHHLIAGASLGAGIALAGYQENWSGKLVVLGTPAEETEGGKVQLVQKGAFQECDAALMFHPGQSAVINISSQALEALEVTFTGVYGHSAGRGEWGNPLVGLVNLYQETLNYNKDNNPEQEIQGIISVGGITPNLIPEKAVGKFYLRAVSTKKLKKVINDFKIMAEKAASLNKTQVTIRNFEYSYLPMNTNFCLANIFIEQANSLGISVDMQKYQIVGSMDMGNVSWKVPAIHPYLTLDTGGIPAHTPEFTEKAGGEAGEKTMKKATQVLALTALELLTKPYLVEKLWKEHNNLVTSY